jgi:hypothetical protein
MNSKDPKTIDEAVDFLLPKLSLADKNSIAELEEKDLRALHFGLGQFIRNETGLWRDNVPLLLDCQRGNGVDVAMMIPDIPIIHPDDASMLITKALWRRLAVADV